MQEQITTTYLDIQKYGADLNRILTDFATESMESWHDSLMLVIDALTENPNVTEEQAYKNAMAAYTQFCENWRKRTTKLSDDLARYFSETIGEAHAIGYTEGATSTIDHAYDLIKKLVDEDFVKDDNGRLMQALGLAKTAHHELERKNMAGKALHILRPKEKSNGEN